jgi:hypothetical protein
MLFGLGAILAALYLASNASQKPKRIARNFQAEASPWLFSSGDEQAIDIFRAMVSDPLRFSFGDFGLFVYYLTERGFYAEADMLADLAMTLSYYSQNVPDNRYRVFPDVNPRVFAGTNMNVPSAYRPSGAEWYGVPALPSGQQAGPDANAWQHGQDMADAYAMSLKAASNAVPMGAM